MPSLPFQFQLPATSLGFFRSFRKKRGGIDVDLIKTVVERSKWAAFIGKDRVGKKEARRKRGARYFISGYLHSARSSNGTVRRENFIRRFVRETRSFHSIRLLFIN